MKHFLFTRVLLLAAMCGLPLTGNADELNALFLGDQGHHQPARRFYELAPAFESRGIHLEYTEDVSKLTEDNLKQYDALVLYANIDNIDRKYADGLMAYVKHGGGFVPLHCASFCFRNQADLVALMGAQFQSHQTGVFRTEPADVEHPIMKGYGGFESWDETYVHHLHNEKNRTVLEYRKTDSGQEPWTWVRTEGDGRVFYTAWGHDGRTWSDPGFQNLVERGLRWAAGDDPAEAGTFMSDRDYTVPEMTKITGSDKDFEFVDVGNKIPNYTPSKQWGTQGKPLSQMQMPLSPEKSMKHFVVPEGFHVELFVSEPELQGKPIFMTWDEAGRLWVCETYDYPNELAPGNKGRDKIRICEDTDGDYKADKFTVFAEGLSIPTALTFTAQGVLVQNGNETLLLTDTDGDDVSDKSEVVITGWELGDTHGGVSNFQYGLDNWVWAMQGYNNSRPVARGKEQGRFRMGFFRMRPDATEVEFIRSTNNNTWGLGISEEGLIFGSTANGNPSIYMPVANRYYESVRGWAPSLTLSSIADTNDFEPITDKVRQVDHHGGYTAGAGHALYTAREYPQQYWNRTAFVAGPTGHLVGTFVLQPDGSDFHSTSPWNLIASDDEWSAPIMAEVGPDGNVWVVDWYNYIVQHNPTPQGFDTGRGNAYETDLRDKKHGRVYRIVPDDKSYAPASDLRKLSDVELVAVLKDPTMLVRKHAQRLLVQHGSRDAAVIAALVDLVKDQSTDEIGLNAAAIHAMWTLHGLGALDGSNANATAAVVAALRHPSAGVRRNAIEVLPKNEQNFQAIADSMIYDDIDPIVRLAALLAIADGESDQAAGAAVLHALADPRNLIDRWIPDAMTSAAAAQADGFLSGLGSLQLSSDRRYRDNQLELIAIVADHFVRGDDAGQAPAILASLSNADSDVLQAVVTGMNRGWRNDSEVTLTADVEAKLETVFTKADTSTRGQMVRLVERWGSERLAKFGDEVADKLLEKVVDESLSTQQRLGAAKELVDFRPNSDDVVEDLFELITPQTAPDVAAGVLAAVSQSRAEAASEIIVEELAAMTPSLKAVAIRGLLSRPTSTVALLDAVEDGKLPLTDLALDQQQALASHPDRQIRERAAKVLAQGGALPSADRQKVLDEYAVAAEHKGDAVAGKQLFTKNCAQCHKHSGEGNAVGPDLTGMAVHPKEELLVHILDPSRSVEGNFRAYSVLTVDGVIISGMLASESKTAIELFDTQGKPQTVLRSDIEKLVASRNSIMPEGFEKTLSVEQMTDLLEFLTKRGQFTPLDLHKVATVASDKSMFVNPNAWEERMVFRDWSPKTFEGVPFVLIDPENQSVPNVVVLYGSSGQIARKYPKSVSLPVSGPVKSIHMLSGVAGWAYPYGQAERPALVVRLHYADGQTEDHTLVNGQHFADYIRRVDVPKSKFAYSTGGGQIRYLSVMPKRSEPLSSIELRDGSPEIAPVVMAITVEQ
ncbi:PVC-type heme-binding CxxCH protein [Rhodopirellula sp. MGV]|uniref:PVC-type heme-binding CxxCH protein n=1 Tax=Rhodopirellula sp. MGV TaxID=2023130 RepID=UPI000B971AE8|nr:PVC-type heme-binding CxxCH protein [Rhodopirellula sp. MGV]OYP37073.1 glycosyl hydrolase [Rhodopirellula sp. MGV]PNY36164.1 glycosyl hydrolase [Rhodopirellula baltica]